MTWLKIDDGFVEHPKISDLSDRAFRLHMAGLCYCSRNLTDGHLTVRATKVVCALTGAARRQLVELRNAGIWKELDDGWLIKDFLDYNLPADEVKKRRRAAAERQRTWRERHTGGNASGNALRDAAPDPGPSQTRKEEPSRPVAAIESVGAALALLQAIPDAYRDAGTRKVILAYADEGLPAQDFHDVQVELAGRDDIRNPAKYANGALKKRAMRRHLEAA